MDINSLFEIANKYYSTFSESFKEEGIIYGCSEKSHYGVCFNALTTESHPIYSAREMYLIIISPLSDAHLLLLLRDFLGGVYEIFVKCLDTHTYFIHFRLRDSFTANPEGQLNRYTLYLARLFSKEFVQRGMAAHGAEEFFTTLFSQYFIANKPYLFSSHFIDDDIMRLLAGIKNSFTGTERSMRIRVNITLRTFARGISTVVKSSTTYVTFLNSCRIQRPTLITHALLKEYDRIKGYI